MKLTRRFRSLRFQPLRPRKPQTISVKILSTTLFANENHGAVLITFPTGRNSLSISPPSPTRR